ncbi:MAG: hypothetical protein ACI9JM_002839 [Halioglobus sp.]|jgi:hypothetical protein
MRNFPKLASILLLGLGLVSPGVSAYNIIMCNSLTAMTGYGVRSFNYGSNLFSSEEAAFTTAMSRTGRFSAANPTGLAVSDTSVALNNGQNEIWYDSSHPTAVCNIYWSDPGTTGDPCVVTETDIRIGSPTWITVEDSSHSPYVTPLSSARSVQGTAVHEIGHCVGLGHENSTYNIMGQEWDHVTRNNTTTFYGLGEDASNGLIAIHGERSGGADTYRDVGATIFRYEAASGEYSAHKWGRLLTTGGAELAKSGSYVGQDTYLVNAGQSLQMELTLENSGEMNTETVNVGFYLSSNDHISTTDTLLEIGTGYTLGRNTVFETTRTVAIPVGTAPGNWFLGAYADHDNLISETTGLNNITYYPITVVAPPSDLTVPFAGVDDSTLHPGQAFSALAIARNDGDGPSAATTLRYYRSTNAIISTGDTQIGTDSIPVLAAGAIQAGNAPDTAPVTEGTWWIGACIDSVPGESNTANQCSTAAEITVAVQPPTATTDPVTDITAISVTARASVNPNGGTTTLYFDYGTDNQYGNTVTYGIVGSGTTTLVTNIPVTGLICNTTYQVRARAVNSAGTTIGTVQEFTTLICAGCL